MHLGDVFQQSLAVHRRDRPVFSGFSAARDVVLSLSGEAFTSMQRAEKVPLSDITAPPPQILRSLADIAAYFADCLAQGHGTDVPLEEPEVAESMTAYFPHRTSIGGTGVQTANCLAHFGFTNLTAHVPYLAPAIHELLHPAITVIANNDHYDCLMPDRKKFAGTHFILDYAAGTQVAVKNGLVTAARPDRVILGGHPYNRRLRVAPGFQAAVTQPCPEPVLILAGFNAPREFDDFLLLVDDCVQVLDAFRRHHQAVAFVHLEECHHANQPRERREVMRERIWPLVDSIGMNENEFVSLCDFLTIDDDDIWRNLASVAKSLDCNRACLHTAERCLVASRYPSGMEHRALGMGVILASARAYYGDFADEPAVHSMLETLLPQAEQLPVPEPRVLNGGFAGVEVPSLRGLPVASSIGLGDAFTAGSAVCLG